MRTLSKFLAALLVCQSLVTVCCTAASANTPGDVGKQFINYAANKNFDGCFSLLSKKAIGQLEGGLEGLKRGMRIGPFDFKRKISSAKVVSMTVERERADRTRADVYITSMLDLDFSGGGRVVTRAYPCSWTFQLVIENGAWKIDDVSVEEGIRSGTPVPADKPTSNSLNDEAVKAVKDFWEEHASKCGNSYFSSEDFRGIITIHQYKDVSFSARQTGPNSESDRLNGILWNGEVQIRTTAYRQRNEGSWSEWGQNRTMSQGWYNVGATKRNSGWSIVQLLAISEQRKVNCSEMPQE